MPRHKVGVEESRVRGGERGQGCMVELSLETKGGSSVSNMQASTYPGGDMQNKIVGKFFGKPLNPLTSFEMAPNDP